MKWMDGHCDVLWRMWEQTDTPRSFYVAENYDCTYPRMQKAGVKLQWFALFVPMSVPHGQRFLQILKQVDLFHSQILQEHSKVVQITELSKINNLQPSQVGAILHLEGADGLEGNLTYLRILYQLGVRQIGLTWNYANEVADGIWEERNGGFTRFGRQLIQEMQRLRMVADVSHLSVRGFWELMEMEIPVVASHSNCQAICQHRRNLSDQQIRALIAKRGLIGINFIPFFIHNQSEQATIDGVLEHIDHICQLGGSDALYFGSDFDGDDEKLAGLESMGQLPQLKERLLKKYPASLVEKWTWGNGYRFYGQHLARSK